MAGSEISGSASIHQQPHEEALPTVLAEPLACCWEDNQSEEPPAGTLLPFVPLLRTETSWRTVEQEGGEARRGERTTSAH